MNTNTPFTSQNLVHLFGFPFQNAQWKQKGLLGALLFLVAPFSLFLSPVFVMGYIFRIMRGIISAGREPFLPEWDRWESLFVDGIRLVWVSLIFSSPILILYGLGTLFSFFTSFINVVLSGLLEGSNQSAFPLLTLASIGITWTFYGAAILLSLVIGPILPAPLCHVAAKGTFGAAFKFNEWWPIFRANFGGFILSYVIIIGSSLVFGFAYQVLYFTVILCCTIPIVACAFGFYISLVSNVLYAQAYRVGMDKVKDREPVVPDN